MPGEMRRHQGGETGLCSAFVAPRECEGLRVQPMRPNTAEHSRVRAPSSASWDARTRTPLLGCAARYGGDTGEIWGDLLLLGVEYLPHRRHHHRVSEALVLHQDLVGHDGHGGGDEVEHRVQQRHQHAPREEPLRACAVMSTPTSGYCAVLRSATQSTACIRVGTNTVNTAEYGWVQVNACPPRALVGRHDCACTLR